MAGRLVVAEDALSRWKRCTGSYTRVPAWFSAAMRTSGGEAAEVRRRARHALVEPGVGVTLPGVIAGVRQGDRTVGDLPAAQPLPQRRGHSVLDGAQERERKRAGLDVQPEPDPG